MKNIEFSAARLEEALTRLGIEKGTPLCVGFSAGRDSRVLLQALVDLQWSPLRAVHVNHQLQAASDAWADRAQAVCRDLQVACVVTAVAVRKRAQMGMEAAARAARYEAYRRVLQDDEVLVLAHHADDQAETVLLQLLRGAGIDGLMGMAPIRPFARGRLARPLLAFPAQAIESFASARGLEYVVDPTNRDVRYRRSYLRAEVMPRLRAYWPHAESTIARSARQLQRVNALWSGCEQAELAHCIGAEGELQIEAWRALDEVQRLHVLRIWIRRHKGVALAERSLLALGRALSEDPSTRHQRIALAGGVVRRYRGKAWWGETAPRVEAAPTICPWRPPAALDWPEAGVFWSVAEARGQGLAITRLAGRPLTVRFRQAGERGYIPGRGHRPIKKLLQEIGVAPWLRARTPLVWDGDNLVAVGVIWIAPFYRAAGEEPGWVLSERRSDEEVV